MERCEAVLRAFPPDAGVLATLSDEAYERLMRAHVSRVNGLFHDSAAKVAAHAVGLLNRLDPAVYSYSFLTLLDSILPTEAALYATVEPVVGEKMVAFLMVFDPRQVRFAGSAFTHLFSAAGSGMILPAAVAVRVLARALEKLDPAGHMLTSNHLTLAKLAYFTRHVDAALPVLSKDIVFYPGMASSGDGTGSNNNGLLCSMSLPAPAYLSRATGLTLPLKSSQVLEFDYLVGLLYCHQRAWGAAHEAFARCVSYPVRDAGVSRIMAEAHKKWILTGLLWHGQVGPVPAQTSSYASRAYGVMNKAYVQVAEAFADVVGADPSTEGHSSDDGNNAALFMAEVVRGREDFVADANEGLVQEVVASLPKWRIAQLSQVYSRVSMAVIRRALEAVPSEVRPADDAQTVALIRDMIETGIVQGILQAGPSEASTAAAAAAAATATATTTATATADTSATPPPPQPPTTDDSLGDPSTVYLEFLSETDSMTEKEFAAAMARVAARIRALEPLYKTTNESLSLNSDYIRHMLQEKTREKERADRGSVSGSIMGDGGGGLLRGGGLFDYDVDEEDLMTDVTGGL